MELKIFPSHYKGEETRQRIIQLLSQKNGLSLEEIATNINKSVVQTQRQLKKIHSVGGVFFEDNRWFKTSKADELNLTSYWS